MRFSKEILMGSLLLFQNLSVMAQTPQELFSTYKEQVIVASTTPEDTEKMTKKIQEALIQNNPLSESQYFIAVDRNPVKENLYIGFYDNDTKTFTLSDPAKVSTGSTRKKHFITPVGWFENLPENGSHRALGTKNENGIRGLGKKGMRVWDFGWQKAQAGWEKKEDIRDIRLQMHATDPDFLEQRLGKPDSEGCVRVQAKMNEFLDKYGIIDKKYEEQQPQSWVLRKDRTPVEHAGSYLLVVDTSLLDAEPVVSQPVSTSNK